MRAYPVDFQCIRLETIAPPEHELRFSQNVHFFWSRFKITKVPEL